MYFFVWHFGSGRELKETLEYGDHSYIPLGAVSPDEHPGHIFFFLNLNRFFVTVTVFCARAARMLIWRGIVLI